MKAKNRWTKKRMVWLIILVVVFILVYPCLYTEILKAAIRDDDIARAKAILALPGDVNFRVFAPSLEIVGHTPLDVACMDDNYEMMELLLENGAKASVDKGFRQPLAYILANKYDGLLACTKLLVEHGAEINMGDGSSEQPIEWLFGRSDYRDRSTLEEANAEVFATLVYLVEHGARVAANHKYGTYGAFLNTVKNENYRAITYLVYEQGLNINQPAWSGETVLMSAAAIGNLKTVELLFELGADKSLADKDGKTAYDYAVENGYFELAERLKP